MALFTDGPPAGVEDISAQDSQLLSVAAIEGIDVTQKLALAHEELGIEISTLLMRMRNIDPLLWVSEKPKLDIVAVTPALKLWHSFRALEAVYADAFNNQLNDRYAGKRDQYREKARWAYDKLVQNGIGIVEVPVAKARTPNLSAAAGQLPDGSYYVTMAWVNRAGEEGESAPPSVTTTSSSTFLVQPTGEVPENAVGWNIYVGPAPDCMIRQNPSVLTAGETWLQPNRIEPAGRNPGGGQKPSYIQPVPRILGRG
jgi:hypothetical protein